MSVNIKIGDALFLQPLSANDDTVYKAKVADLTDEYIAIEMPVDERNNKIGFFLTGTHLDVWFWTEEGVQYSFRSIMFGRKQDNIPLTLISYPLSDTVEKTQRRDFVRVSCYEEVAIHPKEKGEFEPFLTKTIDVSGGGMAFSLKQKPSFKEGVEIEWWLCLPLKSGEILHPSGGGKVVRIVEEQERARFHCSVQFISISEAERQQLIRFTFEKQLEYKHKLNTEQ